VQISYTKFYILAFGRQIALPALLSDCRLYRLQTSHERLLVPSVGTYCQERDILYTIYCTRYIVRDILYTIYCTRYIVHDILYTIYCTRYIVRDILYTIYCTRYIVHDILYTIYCTRYIVRDILYTIYYTRYIVRDILYTIYCTRYAILKSGSYTRSLICVLVSVWLPTQKFVFVENVKLSLRTP